MKPDFSVVNFFLNIIILAIESLGALEAATAAPDILIISKRFHLFHYFIYFFFLKNEHDALLYAECVSRQQGALFPALDRKCALFERKTLAF